MGNNRDYIESIFRELDEDQVSQIRNEAENGDGRTPYVAIHVCVCNAGIATTVSFMSEEGVFYYNWDENYNDFYLELSEAIEVLDFIGK